MKKYGFLIVIFFVLVGIYWQTRGVQDNGSNENAQDTEVSVQSGKIVSRDMRSIVTAYGTVAPVPAGAEEAASARLAPSVSGVVVTVNVAEGQAVNKGTLLFKLDSRAADETVAFAKTTLERQKQLAKDGNSSQKLVDAAQHDLDAALVQQALLKVTAPLAGIVTKVNVKPGDAVDLTTNLAEIVDLNRLVVNARVPSNEIMPLMPGQKAEIQMTDAKEPIAGTLSYIASDVDTSTGTVAIRISLPANSGLRPGQFVPIHIVSNIHKDSLTVPNTSIVKNENDETLIAVIENGIARQVPVEEGIREGDFTEIIAENLKPEMKVVTLGAYALPDQTKVREINRQGNDG
ncbi:MAG: efflux RND transporter periplasmic adaptor subunit [Alphaproteobacteria bacterium]|nr:efflux RND transporter periplasmic adaptor subunit [Alphaproteobacteria bacterium]HPF46355.1 efflux RND transporter periplasmic adaptor subunit [Emcibacteraceae bacterium]HRW29340.1 efflux RND transporter periplasmic adaptor subunit [Emcibacteraceae bacterium]